jgi:4-amino-4-deoxy-L-arabinose transferase-like glycosyltransferase
MADASIKTLIPGYVLAGLFFLACIVVALIQDQHRSVLFLLCLLGAALGWGLGLLFTSAPEEEGSWGRKIMQAVVAGASGFTVAKFQEIANSALVKAILPRFEDVFMGGVLFSVCVVLGILVSAVWRRHRMRVESVQGRGRAIAKIRRLLSELD